jgi:hypothetical protein
VLVAILTKVKISMRDFPYHAGPWRRAAAEPQDGLLGYGGEAAGPQLSILNVTLSFAAKPLTHYSTKEFL